MDLYDQNRVNYILGQLTDYRGLSFGSFSLNWYSLTFFLNSPLVVPRWALVKYISGICSDSMDNNSNNLLWKCVGNT